MYNFNLLEDEKVNNIFDNIKIKQKDSEKNTTIILTNKRLLFLDYINDYREDLRVSKNIDYIKYKEVYYEIYLYDIKNILKNKIILKNNIQFEFDDKTLYELLREKLQNNYF